MGSQISTSVKVCFNFPLQMCNLETVDLDYLDLYSRAYFLLINIHILDTVADKIDLVVNYPSYYAIQGIYCNLLNIDW